MVAEVLEGRLVPHGPLWSRSTATQLAAARKEKEVKETKKKLEQKTAQVHEMETKLQTAASLIPGAGKLLGTSTKAQQVARVKNPEPKQFSLLCAVLLCPGLVQLQLGVKRTRLILVAKLALLQRQFVGLEVLLTRSGS